MMDNTSLGDRMKGYENITRNKLMCRTPVIVRLDGKAFHTYTRGCDRPYDEELHNIRESTMRYLVDNIQGCVLGYSQSDEISLVLKDWQTYKTEPWFGNSLQKICSVSASMCTSHWMYEVGKNPLTELPNKVEFDSRVWNLPKEEVVNYLIWRQQDWKRNSILMLAQSLYSHKQLQGLRCDNIVSKIEEEYGIVWRDLSNWAKSGEFYMKPSSPQEDEYINFTPIFSHSSTRYIIETELNRDSI